MTSDNHGKFYRLLEKLGVVADAPEEHVCPSDAMFGPALADIACAHQMLKQVQAGRYWMKTEGGWRQLDQWTYDTLCECGVNVTLAREEA